MPRILKTAALIAILVLAVFFRFFSIGHLPPGLYPDEAINGNNALEALDTNQFKVFYPENNGREGLFINIQAVFLKFLLPLTNSQPEPWMLRLPSAVFGVLTVLGIYFLAKNLFVSYSIGLLSAFFAATSFWHINFSRIGFRAIMAPFFLTWTVYFLIKVFQNKNLTCQPVRRESFILNSVFAGLFFGLGFYSYIAYRITPLLILFIFWFYWRVANLPAGQAGKNGQSKRFLTAAGCFLFFAFIVVLPLGLYFLNHPQDFFGRTAQISVFQSQTPLKDLGLNILKTAGMFNIAGDTNWRHNIAGRPLLFWPVGIFFLVGLFFGIRNLFRNQDLGFPPDRLAGKILFVWLIVVALPVVISNEGLPHALRAILVAPPVFILAAIGGLKIHKWLIAKNLSRQLLIAVYAFLFAILIVQAYYSYFIVWGTNPNTADAFNQEGVELAKKIRSLPNESVKKIGFEGSADNVRGLPMPLQTVMFLTDSFTKEKQVKRNIFYFKTEQENMPVSDAGKFVID